LIRIQRILYNSFQKQAKTLTETEAMMTY